jgi:DNA replication protein DnaD
VLLNNSSWSEDGRKQINKVKGKKERNESQEKEKRRKAGKVQKFSYPVNIWGLLSGCRGGGC